MRVLVAGATGFVGSRLVASLVDHGHDVVALTRDAERYDKPEGVDVVEGDLLDPPLELPSADAAYYLVHSMGAGGDFAARDRRAATSFAEAAEQAGIGRVIYLGGLGDEGDDLSEHLRSRREVEQVLGERAFELTTLRAAVIVGSGSASFELIRQLADRLPVMVTPRWVRTDCQPIYIDDVVAYLVGVLEAPATAGETFEIGGPKVLTYEDMLRTVAAQQGHRLRIVPVPVLSPWLSAHWLRLFTDVPAGVARPLVAGLRNAVTVSERRIDEHVEVELTPFDEAVQRALADGESGGA
ncbi:arNOG08307 family NADH-binding domain protein [Natronomonas pharaonis DSM 2160]|uniref:ArNOG08307 family NADH-binding domain protein n=1 Tax=Natronomonas pharaonis (strain ATCC 35678 / DSM 2160 / CIP 103997 / JCM 8858 / NBRC 14720 / NCIMB 2260 / Gabara) TaxID=348780 RepID=A0A1U7EU32_NATPD|nr:NAD(P)H-binding protein [Natronomonas pharaonis]CAI48443.1 arNOG08307 family NADH-binding domain protein [Natronomonas pharaonis DSM 2160]